MLTNRPKNERTMSVDFMLPRMDVVSTGLTGIDNRVGHGTGWRVVLQ
jgi:hypothetical protein